MAERCSELTCSESAIALIGEQRLCSKHFIEHSYQQLEEISASMREPRFHEKSAETSARHLEDCMRGAADIACSPQPPSNLERARVIDVLLWASELHGRLRRSPRVSARIPILLRSEAPDHPWEEKTETLLLSRYGMQLNCRSEIHPAQILICIRLDTGSKAEVRVAWTRRTLSNEIEAGLEFSDDENFWGVTWGEGPSQAS